MLWFTTGAGTAPASAQPAAPELHVSAPATKHAGVAADIVVTVANPGRGPVIVPPNAVRLRIEGAGAEYVPYPGPAIDPWAGARELDPGERTTVRFPDASDKRGVWKLPPGDYLVIATYDVAPDLAPPAGLMGAALVWRGRTESPPAAITVVPAR